MRKKKVNAQRKRGPTGTRSYLRPEEVASLVKAAESAGRNGHRDATAIRLAFRHGLQAAEVCSLRRDHFDLKRREIQFKRAGELCVKPIYKRDLAAIRKILRGTDGQIVFATERGTPLERIGFFKVVRRAGQLAGIPFPVHPRMLPDAAGHYLIEAGANLDALKDFLGEGAVQRLLRRRKEKPTLKSLWSGAPL